MRPPPQPTTPSSIYNTSTVQPVRPSQPPPPPVRPSQHQFTSPYAETRPHPMPAKNLALILINLATLLLSIPILVMGIWLAARHHADCLSFLEWPLIVIGIVMMVMSLIGLLGALRRRALLLWVYLCLLTLIILLLLCFTIFAFVVTRGSKGHRVQGGIMKEYVLGDYSHWMKNKVRNLHNWGKIKRCLLKDQVCSNLDIKYPSQSVMFNSKLSYIESGCCKPPSACCFTFVNATNWVNPITAGADADCGRWSNDPMQLCYNCDACKAAVIRQVDKDWRKAAKVALAVLCALALLYILAWLTFLQALAHKALYSTSHSFGASHTTI